MKGTAIHELRRFRIEAEILSCPVALLISNLFSRRFVVRERNATKSSNSMSGEPKKGVSTASAGSWALLAKVCAKTSALALASEVHVAPSRSVGIDEMLACLLRSIRFNRHHCLLRRGS